MSKILVVDSDKYAKVFLSHLLKSNGYVVKTAQDGIDALYRLTEETFDLLLTDIVMPKLNGLELLKIVRRQWQETLPVIVMTDHESIESDSLIMEAGAIELITKPFNKQQVVHVVKDTLDILESRKFVKEPVDSPMSLEEQLTMNAVQSIFMAMEAKAPAIIRHSARVACYALLMGKRLGLKERDVRRLEYLALLHDVGKISLTDDLIEKTKGFSSLENERIKQHVSIGEQIVGPLHFISQDEQVIYHHHEQYDGGGYPDKLSGDAIPLFSRIIMIADSFDKYLTRSSQKNRRAQKRIIKKMFQDSGKKYDPELLHVFISAYSNMIAASNESIPRFESGAGI